MKTITDTPLNASNDGSSGSMPRLVAFYLPQFHAIPENDAWWGKGFTEWTNTAKAKPLFPGHYQPHVPADLGAYDLRMEEIRKSQAQMASAYGVEAFCYYHYWFGNGRRLLEKPFNEVLSSGEPDFPFCLCWANESWTGIWHGAPGRMLIQQRYPGPEDDERHFMELLPAFRDHRYVTVDGKPMFVIYKPQDLPNARGLTAMWHRLAVREGLPGIYLVGIDDEGWESELNGFDGATIAGLPRATRGLGRTLNAQVRHRFRRLVGRPPEIYSYKKACDYFIVPQSRRRDFYPCVIPNWDNTPRSARDGLVLHRSTPELFRRHLRAALSQVKDKPPEHQLVFVKSWNEWGEGNHLEPDVRYGRSYLDVLREEVNRFSTEPALTVNGS